MYKSLPSEGTGTLWPKITTMAGGVNSSSWHNFVDRVRAEVNNTEVAGAPLAEKLLSKWHYGWVTVTLFYYCMLYNGNSVWE